MTEEIKDDQEPAVLAVPTYLRVVRLQEHPYEHTRGYCVMQKMVNENNEYMGWKHVSKTYVHSTSAFAALGRLIQKSREKSYSYLPEEQR